MLEPNEPGSSDAPPDSRDGTEVLILVSVAPTPPYPELFATGPAKTWMASSVDGVVVKTYSGLPIPPLRRPFTDIREMLRFPGAHPKVVGTVSAQSLPLRAYGAAAGLSDNVHRSDASTTTRLAGRVAHGGLVLAGRAVDAWEGRTILNGRRRRFTRVTESEGHLTVHRTATVSNSLAIERDLLAYLAAAPPLTGVLFVTASAFVDQERFLRWVAGPGREVFVAGSNALAARDDGEPPLVFFSGFCQYFSWRAINVLARAEDFDFSVPNDVALTQWLLKHDIGWEDPGIVWFTTELEAGRCPLCEDRAKFVVRCTRHGERARERELMALLNHAHVREPAN